MSCAACGRCTRQPRQPAACCGLVLPAALTQAAPTALLPLCPQWNLRGLVEMIFDYLKLIRIYTKPKGALPALPTQAAVWCGAGQGVIGAHQPADRRTRLSSGAVAVVTHLCWLPAHAAGKLPDWQDPVVLSSQRCTVEDFCNRSAGAAR